MVFEGEFIYLLINKYLGFFLLINSMPNVELELMTLEIKSHMLHAPLSKLARFSLNVTPNLSVTTNKLQRSDYRQLTG